MNSLVGPITTPSPTPTTWEDLGGCWELVSSEVEYQCDGCRRPMYLAPAVGYMHFTNDHRVTVVVEVIERPPHASDLPTRPGSRGMAYAGVGTISDGVLSIFVEASLLHGWRGTLQRRHFEVDMEPSSRLVYMGHFTITR